MWHSAPGVLWILLSIASSWFIGGYEVARKAAVGQGQVNWVLLSVTLGGLLVLSPLPVLSCFAPHWVAPLGLDVKLWGPREHGLVFVKALIVSSAWVFSYAAIKHLPISVAGPLRATSPVLTVSFALLLFGEQPSPGQWLGMSVIFAGHVGFARLGRQEGIVYSKNRFILLLLLGTTIGSMSGLYDKLLLQQLRLPATSLQFWFTFYGAVLQGTWLVLSQRRVGRQLGKREAPPSEPHELARRFPFIPAAAAAGVLLVLADQLYMRAVAMPDALISVVSLTRRSSVLISFSLGGLLFRERLLKKKALPLGLVLLGLGLLLL